MPWGQTIAYVADINGFLVELCTPMGWMRRGKVFHKRYY